MNPTLVVCRPLDQARKNVEALRAAGVEAVELPLLEVSAMAPAPESVTRLRETLQAALHAKTARSSIAIFVSQNAVAHGAQWFGGDSEKSQVIAVGAATGAALGKLGFSRVQTPNDIDATEDSEGVLQLPVLTDIAEKDVFLVRGQSNESDEGGRRLLADELRSRGARLTELVCYRRNKRILDAETRSVWQTRMRESTPPVWVLGSVESLDAWCANFAPNQQQRNQTIWVPHPRVAAAARERGWVSVVVTKLDSASLLETYRASL